MLSPYSQRFADTLFTAYPEWRPLQRDYPNGDMSVSVPAPRDGSPALNIYAEGEITISYHHWHTHFDWLNDGEDEAFSDALAFISDFLKEEVCIAARWKGERPSGAETSTPGSVPTFGPGITRISVLSWRGTHDQEFLAS